MKRVLSYFRGGRNARVGETVDIMMWGKNGKVPSGRERKGRMDVKGLWNGGMNQGRDIGRIKNLKGLQGRLS